MFFCDVTVGNLSVSHWSNSNVLNLVSVDVQDFAVYQNDAVVTNRYSDAPCTRGLFIQWKRRCDMALSAEIEFFEKVPKPTYVKSWIFWMTV